MKSKFLNTLFISLALFAIYITIFYSKDFEYGFILHSNFYEYIFHAIILILPITILFIVFYNIHIKNQAVSLEKERLINQEKNQLAENLNSRLLNYEKEIERIHEKYVNLSIESDAIMIQFNDIVEKFINNQLEKLDKSDSNKEKLIQQMFYDLAHPIRVKLSNLKTITATAIESLKRTELKNESIKKEYELKKESIKKEYEGLLENKEGKIKENELINFEKDNLINSLKDIENEYKRKISSLKEKVRTLEIENKIINDKLKQVDFSDSELLMEVEKLQKENSKVLGLLDKIKPYRKKYSK